MSVIKLNKEDMRKAIADYISRNFDDEVYIDSIEDIEIQDEDSRIIFSDCFDNELLIDVKLY